MTNKDDSLVERLRGIFVTIDTLNLRLSPIEKIVYGGAAAVGIAIVGAVISLVIKK